MTDANFIVFNERLSDSPFVERVWRCHSERAGRFLSVASTHAELVVSRVAGRTFATLRGPETKVTTVDCPADGEWFSIRFTAGTFMPHLPIGKLLDGRDATLPEANARAFWLNGAKWEYPNFENAECFVARLARAGIITRDPAVAAALEGDPLALSKRSAQRHFLHATGMTYGQLRQIERARRATLLLRQGMPILDTALATGYFDQAHLTRSLRTLIGLTPASIARGGQQLSFLY
jgi:hypothetical protein